MRGARARWTRPGSRYAYLSRQGPSGDCDENSVRDEHRRRVGKERGLGGKLEVSREDKHTCDDKEPPCIPCELKF